jgi:hypothetical protein
MRGRPATCLKDEAKKCAEQMGYHWLENTNAGIHFDGMMYQAHVMIAVKLKKTRYGLAADCIIKNKFPEDVAEIRALPLPSHVLRELWVRTQNERAFRRFFILPDSTAEIEENTRENYRNTHYREAYWKKAPYRIEIPIPGREIKRDEVK